MFKHTTPVPTEADFQYVHPAPRKYLCPDLLPPDKIYHVVMKEKLWTSWSGDSHGIVYYDDHNKPFEVDVKGKSLSLRGKSFVRNAQGEVIAVCAEMIFEFETTFKIYGLEPYREGQEPSTSQNYEGKPLYEWARCKNNFFSVKKTMKMVDGVKFVMDGVGKVFDYRQMRITRDGKPAVHCKEINLGIFEGNQWEVRIGPGIDAAMIIAFMAVMDKMNEK